MVGAGYRAATTHLRAALWLLLSLPALAQNPSALSITPQTFQMLPTYQQAFVLGSNFNLWLENAPFGKVPPQRVQVDGNVWTFQALDQNNVFVLGTDGNLWLEHAPFGAVPPQRSQVDGSVWTFQALDANNVFVLGTDGDLWLEKAPFGKVPPQRVQVDGNVEAFQALDAQDALVLGNNGALWMEQAPFGNVPPKRQQVDGDVASFQGSRTNGDIFVLGKNGNLWLEQPPYGNVPPARQQVDGNVLAFQALPALNWAWVLGTNGNLWLETGPFGKVPPSRQQADGNVLAFQALDIQNVTVLGTNGNLWFEHAPFGKVPPNRQQIDGNVLKNAKPGGTYLQTCTGSKMVQVGVQPNTSNLLFANCRDDFGNSNPTSLASPESCTGSIQNIHGFLRCVVRIQDGIIGITTQYSSTGVDRMWTIDEPTVTQPSTAYPEISYRPGDLIMTAAGGCVQTGGSGKTWKSYVNPQGANAANYYFGEVKLPGTGLEALQPIAQVVNQALWRVASQLPPTIPDSALYLTLGYTDNNYGDNGYYSHDDGNPPQCVNVGPAWVYISLDTPTSSGPTPPVGTEWSPGSMPFDLVWDVNSIDANGLPFNPRWYPQIRDLTLKPNFGATCGPAFTIGSNVASYSTTVNIGELQQICTTQAPTLDVVGQNLYILGGSTGYCHDAGSPLTGHLNWGIATYTGNLYWDDWSTGIGQDHDFNFGLIHGDFSGLTAASANEDPPGDDSFHLEFFSDETIDKYFASPWWQNLRKYAENTSTGEQASQLVDGPGIITGEIGIDGVHSSGYSELHPVYALAVHILSDDKGGTNANGENYVDQHWVFFIRNQGTEGNCSEFVHTWPSLSDASDYYIQLPWPTGANRVSVQGGTAYLWQSYDSLGPVQISQGNWTYLQFILPLPPNSEGSVAGSGSDGDIVLRYTFPQGKLASQANVIRAAPKATENPEVNWDQIKAKFPNPSILSKLEAAFAVPAPSKAPPAHPLTFGPNVAIFIPNPIQKRNATLIRSHVGVDPAKQKRDAEINAALSSK